MYKCWFKEEIARKLQSCCTVGTRNGLLQAELQATDRRQGSLHSRPVTSSEIWAPHDSTERQLGRSLLSTIILTVLSIQFMRKSSDKTSDFTISRNNGANGSLSLVLAGLSDSQRTIEAADYRNNLY